MADTPNNTDYPISEDVESDEKKSLEERILGEVVQMMGSDLEQTLTERRQRSMIGWGVAIVVGVLPLCLVGVLWWFILCYLDVTDLQNGTWAFAVMFSSTYIAVVALYFSLIQGMFQRKKDNEIPLSMLHKVKSLLEQFAKSG